MILIGSRKFFETKMKIIPPTRWVLGVWISFGLTAACSSFAAAGTDAGGYEVIANAFGFGVDIPGCGDASKNIREVHIDELTIDAREMTSGLDVEYRLYGPGHAHW